MNESKLPEDIQRYLKNSGYEIRSVKNYSEWYIENGMRSVMRNNFKFERFANKIATNNIECVCDIDTLTLKGCICRKELI